MSRNLQATFIQIPKRLAWEPDLESVYHDDHALASYARLSMLADSCWPMPASLPRDLDQAVIDLLARLALIELRAGGTFGIPGQDENRQKRVTAAKKAGLASVESPAHHDLPNVARTMGSNEPFEATRDARTISSNAISNHANANANANGVTSSLRSDVPPGSPLDLEVELVNRGMRGGLRPVPEKNDPPGNDVPGGKESGEPSPPLDGSSRCSDYHTPTRRAIDAMAPVGRAVFVIPETAKAER